MTHTFHPTLLLSMPQLRDPNFAQTVILLCDYLPEGAFGLVVNRPTDAAATSMVRVEPPVESGNDLVLYTGGPVEPGRGWILTAEEPVEPDYRTIVDGLYLSTSPALLRRVLETRPSPRAVVLAGYAGWGPGQLDAELAQSAWLMSDVALDIIFDTDPGIMWEAAIRRIGADPSTLQMSHGVH
ncbi:MAG: YqgE/AlgH family protein [Acidobacteriota bacterium]|nr:YqgE/AlgH family protein [Acidobacteriota bacterium]